MYLINLTIRGNLSVIVKVKNSRGHLIVSEMRYLHVLCSRSTEPYKLNSKF